MTGTPSYAKSLAEVTQFALEGLNAPILTAKALEIVRTTLRADACELLQVIGNSQIVSLVDGKGLHALDRDIEMQALFAQRENRPVIVECLGDDPRFSAGIGDRTPRFTSGITLPMSGKKVGVLTVQTRERRVFSAEDQQFLHAAANVLSLVWERHLAGDAQGRLVTILEATTDLVAVVGPTLQLQYLNRAGRKMLGVGPSEDLARLQVADFFPMKSQRVVLNEAIPRATRNGVWTGDAQFHNRRGHLIPISLLVLAHHDHDGQMAFLSFMAKDVREKQRLEEQFRQAQKMEAIGRLAGGVAHDFNNLLCVINGYSELLLNKFVAGDPNAELVQEILKAGERASHLTRQLLAFSRRQVCLPTSVNLNDLIKNLEKMLARIIGEDIELLTVLAPKVNPINADPGQIEQVLMNLVVNARDAMEHGGKLKIGTGDFDADEEFNKEHPDIPVGAYATLEITDTGSGMSPDVLAHLFEPFFTTKGVGKGSGLGLATVYGIVRNSDGHIVVSSTPGRGTTFRIFFPRFSEATKLEARAPAAKSSLNGREVILLAEDEEGVRSLARRYLEEAGYMVLEARDGEEALGICQDFPGRIHLLVSDVVMPKMNGVSAAREVAMLRPDAKVLLMSGYTDIGVYSDAIREGGFDLLRKPFGAEAFMQKVRETLDGLSKSVNQERRGHPRRKTRRLILLQCRVPGESGPPFDARLLDVSETGVAVALPRYLERRQTIDMVFPIDDEQKIRRRGEVIWARPLADGSFRMGIKLAERLSLTELRSLSDAADEVDADLEVEQQPCSTT
ncbi:MAG: ATP-binding protein [Gemmataceae bacterium]|nr:ATP-binding protein [Gemmataceae bacterium]